jgi:hypothetical protein
MSPKRKVTAWTHVSGNVYSAPFTLGYVSGVYKQATALTAGSSTSPSSNQFYYDQSAQQIFVNLGGTDPTTTFMVAKYEIYSSYRAMNWYRDPLDSSSASAYFESSLQSKPVLPASMSQVLFGHMPAQTVNVTFTNNDHSFDPHLHESSFKGADISLYHYLGWPLRTENIKRVFRGAVSEIRLMDSRVEFSLIDSISFLTQTFDGINFGTTFNGTDVIESGRAYKPYNHIYGIVEGVRAAARFNSTDVDTNTTSGFVSHAGLNSQLKTQYTFTVASGANSTSRTYLTSTTGIYIGDRFQFNRGGTKYYTEVKGVTATYIDHDAIGGAMVAADTILTYCIRKAALIDQGVRTELYPVRDYVVGADVTVRKNRAGDIFSAYDLAIQPPFVISTSAEVYCRIVGDPSVATVSGVAFANGTQSGVNSTAAGIIYDLLRTKLLIPESDINTASFTSAANAVPDTFGIVTPTEGGADFETYSDMITRICASAMLRLCLDADAKWTLSVIAPMPTDATTAFIDDDIVGGAPEFEFSYDDVLSDVIVNYANGEMPNPGQIEKGFKTVKASSDTAKYLHGITAQKSFESLHIVESEAQTYANRLALIFGDRRGTVKINVAREFITSLIGDCSSVTRTKMPGLTYDGETELTRKFVVIENDRSSDVVTLVMDDQKGIEDNSGSW